MRKRGGGVALAGLLQPVVVKARHERCRRLIADGPESGQDVFRARDIEGARQAFEPFGIVMRALARVAGGEDHQFGAVEVEGLRFDGVEDAVFAIRADAARKRSVGARDPHTRQVRSLSGPAGCGHRLWIRQHARVVGGAGY